MKEKNNNKQSSVDQLFDQLSSENLLGLFTHDQMMRAMEILDEAKAMHKEEIVDSIVQYMIKHHNIFTEQAILNTVRKAETYYNETFGGNNGNNNSN